MSNNEGITKEELKKKILDKAIFDPIVDKTFYETDLNKNGYIEKDELGYLLKSIYRTLGLADPPQAEIERELSILDKNGDNKISKDEFRILIRELCLYFIDESF